MHVSVISSVQISTLILYMLSMRTQDCTWPQIVLRPVAPARAISPLHPYDYLCTRVNQILNIAITNNEDCMCEDAYTLNLWVVSVKLSKPFPYGHPRSYTCTPVYVCTQRVHATTMTPPHTSTRIQYTNTRSLSMAPLHESNSVL